MKQLSILIDCFARLIATTALSSDDVVKLVYLARLVSTRIQPDMEVIRKRKGTLYIDRSEDYSDLICFEVHYGKRLVIALPSDLIATCSKRDDRIHEECRYTLTLSSGYSLVWSDTDN